MAIAEPLDPMERIGPGLTVVEASAGTGKTYAISSIAVRALAEGQSGVMVALDPPEIRAVPLDEAVKDIRQVPLDGDLMETARSLGINFGD